MSKQRRGRPPGEREPESAPHAVEGPRAELEPAVGSAPIAAGPERLVDLAGAPEPAGRLADRVGLALRVAPRDAAQTARLVDLVARSGLPPERRQAVTERLLGDQAVADAVGGAVARWLGRDGDALRSELVRALDGVAETLAAVPGGEPEVAAGVAHEAGIEPAAAEGLCRDLGMLVALWFEEDEEEGPPGEYAAEESGS